MVPKAGLAIELPELVDGEEATKRAAAPGLDNNLEGPKLTMGDPEPDPGEPEFEACWWRLIRPGTTLSSKCSIAMEEMSRNS